MNATTTRTSEPPLSPAERHALNTLVGAKARPDGTTHRGMVDSGLVQGYCDLVDRSPVLGDLARWRAAEPRGRGGRPRLYRDTDRLVIVMMLVLLAEGTAPQLKQIAQAIANRLSADSRERLGLPPTNGRATDRAIYGRVWRAWKSFTGLCDPLPGINHLRRTRAETEAIRTARDPEQSRIKAERAERVFNEVVRMPLVLLSQDTLDQWPGHITLDATDAAIHGRRGSAGQRGKHKPDDNMSPEWEASWYHHTAPNGENEFIHAYAAHIAMMGPDPTDPGRHPMLAVAMTMDTPNLRNGQNGITLLRSVSDAGFPAGYVVADRAYGPNSQAQNFTRPAKALGYEPVMDYKVDQLGIRGHQHGANFIEGDWYCPSLPQVLVEATKIFRGDGPEGGDFVLWVKRMEQRKKLALPRKDGDARRCPAQGSSRKAVCAQRPESMVDLGMPGRHRAVVTDPPAEPGKCCTNTSSVSIRDDVDPQIEKLVQPLTFGSRAWHSVYKPLRAFMEGMNGFVKDPVNEGLSIASHRRVRGFFANGFVVAVTLAVANVRKIRVWNDKGQPPAYGPNPWLDPDFYGQPDDDATDHHEPGAWWRDDPPDVGTVAS